MNKALLAEVQQTAAALSETLSAFKQEQINVVPFEGSWTAGQVAEHLLKACLPDALFGGTAPTERAPDQLIPETRIFLNFEIKFKSPDFILPSDGPHRQEDLLRALQQSWDRISDAVKTLDLTETCTDFQVPVMGYLTRLELVHFIMYHTQRHTHQLKNIYRHLTGQPDNVVTA